MKKTINNLFSALVAAVLSTLSAQAQNLYWDINGATAGSGGATPGGIWDAATTANWTTDSTGSSATQVWGSGDNAIFSAGSDATGSFNVTNNGTVTVGNITQNIGHVRIASGSSTPTIALAGTSTITTSTRTTADYDLRIDPTISGGYGIIKQGAGVLLLESASSFTGGFTLNAGTVGVETGGSVFGTGSLTLAGGNIEKSWGANSSTSETVTNAVNVTGTVNAAIVQGNAGNLAFTGPFTGGGTFCVSNITLNGLNIQAATIQISSDISAYTGTFFINVLSSGGNRLRFGSGSGSINLNGAGANFVTAGNTSGGNMLDLADGLYGTFQMGSLSGTGGYLHAGWSTGGNTTFQIGALNSNTTYAGAIDDNVNGSGGHAAVTKVGTGSLTLSGPSTYTLASTIENGSLVAGAAVSVSANGPFGNASSAIAMGDATSISGNLSPSLLIGGAFTMARTVTVGSANTATTGIYTLGGSTANSSTFSGAITLNQSLTVTQATSGTLNITAGITSGASGTQTVTVNNPGAVNIGTSVIGGGIGTIALTKTGAGALTLTGTHTYTGNTTVSGGTLLVNGSTASGSTVSVSGSGSVLGGSGTVNRATTISSSGALTPRPSGGSATTLTFAGNLTLQTGASANFNLGPTAGGANDQVVYGSSSTLTVDNSDTITITGTPLDQTTDYTLFTSSGGTVSMATTPTLVVNGVTSDQASSGNYMLNVSSHALVLHYIPFSGPPTNNSAIASPSSIARNQTTTVTVNVTPRSGQSVTNVTVTADGLGGLGDPTSLTGPGGNGAGNWTGTFSVAAGKALGIQTIAGSIMQNDGSTAAWTVNVTLLATNEVWNGGGADNKWSTVGNWNLNLSPGPGDYVSFDGSTRLTNNLDASLAVGSLTFNSGAGSFDITNAASTLTLAGGLTNNSTSAQQLDVPVALSGTPTINAAAGNVTMNGVVSDSGSGLITAGSSTTVTLAGVNTYTGNTTISAGTLTVGGAGQLGSGTYSGNVTNNGALNINSSAAQTLSGAISGTGSLTNSGSGTLTLSSGSSSFGGGVALNAGTLSVGASSTPTSGTVTSGPLGTNALTLNGGTFNFTGASTYTLANNVNVTAATTIQVASGVNEVLNGNFSGGGNLSLTANGITGQWQFGGDNSGYTGTFTQDTGNNNTSLAFNSANSGSASAAWVFNNGLAERTRFNFGNGTILFGSLSGSGALANVGASGSIATVQVGDLGTSTTFSGTLKNGGSGGIAALTKVGAGTLTISGANNYTGGTTVNGGTLAVSSALTGTTATGALTNNDGGTLQVTVSGTSQLTPAVLVVGSSSGATLEFTNVGSTTVAPLSPTNLVIVGTATINIDSLAGLTAGTYPLVTNYTAGTVALGSLPAHVNAHLSTANNQISLVVDAIAADVWANASGGNWDTATANWKTNGTSMVYANGDPVQFDDTPGGSAIAVTITNPTVSPFSVFVTNSAVTYTIGGNPIAGSAALTKNGNGTLKLTGTNTYTGGTTISAGTLQLGDGSANNGAVAGNITDNGSLVFANPNAQTNTGVVSGSGMLGKTASGVLTLSTAQTYTGGTVVSNGTLNLTVGGSVGTVRGSLTINSGGTVNLTAQDALGYGSGTCVTNVSIAGGVLNNAFANNNGYIANISLTGGTMASTGGGAFTFSTGYGISSSASAMTSTNSAPVSIRGTDLTFTVAQGTTPSGIDLVSSGVIGFASPGTSSSSVTKAGAGTLLFTATNTYTGNTHVSAGTLDIYVGSSASQSYQVDDGATLGIINITGSGQYIGQPSGIGSLTVGTSAGATLLFSNLDSSSPYGEILAGHFTNNGVCTIKITDTNNLVAGNTYQLVGYGGAYAGAGSFVLSAPPTLQGYVTNDTVNDVLSLVVTSIGVLSPSTNAYLTSLVVSNSAGALTFYPSGFTTNNFGVYYATNAYGAGAVTVTVTNGDTTATNTLFVGTSSQGLLTNGLASSPLTLSIGTTNVTVQVVSQDLSVTNSYVVAVTQLGAPVSTDASLSYLALSPLGALTPNFNTTLTNYTATNANADTSVTVTVTNTSSVATNVLFLNGTPQATNAGSLAASVPLVVGSGNVIEVVVTAQDGVTTSTNTVTVTRLASGNALLSNLVITPAGTLYPTFASGTPGYNATNTYVNKTVTVTATSGDGTAALALSFNGTPVGSLTSGTPSGNQTLVLPTNTVAVQVVSQDLSATNVYTVNVLLQPSQSVPKLTNSVSGSTLTLTWPADHLGYRLLQQTNNLNKGVSGNIADWATVSGSTDITATNITMIKATNNAYYKLVYP